MKFSFQISTRNRKRDLVRTLGRISRLLSAEVECVVFDDGSTDGTFDHIKKHFPNVRLLRNEISKGYIFCRNEMLNETDADIAISLDDDSELLTTNPIEIISDYFNRNPTCGLMAFRIFWGISSPESLISDDKPEKVKAFVGCGHAWRMSAWREIPNYPEWYQFYGEENFAALQLFKKQIEIHYVPQILVHHRVDMKLRNDNKVDAAKRFRNSLRADWYNFLIFYPMGKAWRKIAYSCWMQFRTKIFNGKSGLLMPFFGVVTDILSNFSKIRRYRDPLSDSQYDSFVKLPSAKIYWKP